MSETIASLIPAAIGIAISPAAIVELILVIFCVGACRTPPRSC